MDLIATYKPASPSISNAKNENILNGQFRFSDLSQPNLHSFSFNNCPDQTSQGQSSKKTRTKHSYQSPVQSDFIDCDLEPLGKKQFGNHKQNFIFETPCKPSLGSKNFGDVSMQHIKLDCYRLNSSSIQSSSPMSRAEIDMSTPESQSNLIQGLLAGFESPPQLFKHRLNKIGGLEFECSQPVSLFDLNQNQGILPQMKSSSFDFPEKTTVFEDHSQFKKNSFDKRTETETQQSKDIWTPKFEAKSSALNKHNPAIIDFARYTDAHSPEVNFRASRLKIPSLIEPELKTVKHSLFYPQNLLTSNERPDTDSDLLKQRFSSVPLTLRELRPMQNEIKLSRIESEYEVIGVLGTGSFGKVYHCVNKLDRVEYAVKTIDLRRCPEAFKEVQILSYISAHTNCPNIVRYFTSWLEDSKIHIVTELCSQSLEVVTNLMSPRPSEHSLRKLLKHISKALKYLHKNDLVHLDIKPENIVIDSEGKYKLCDFGLATHLNSEEEISEIEEGDSKYLAEEMLDERKLEKVRSQQLDLKKADIFSLGMVVFGIMTMRQLEIPGAGPLWHNLRHGDLPELDHLPEYSWELKALVRRMLNPDFRRRPTASEILKYIKTRDRCERGIEGERNCCKFVDPAISRDTLTFPDLIINLQ